jgi:hypothetical protein
MRLARVAAFGVAVLAVPALAQPPRPVPRVDADVPFAIGETLTYDVTFASVLVAGTATSTVRGRQTLGTSTAYDIVVEGQPLPILAKLYNVVYRMDTLLDTVTLLPHRMTLYAEEANEKRTTTTTFDRSRFKAIYETHASPATTAEFDIPPQAQDGLSSVYLVRTMSVTPGDTFTLHVADGGLLYTVRADIGAPESIVVPLGQHTALPVKLTIAGRDAAPGITNAAAWISTDGRRLPLRLQADLPVGSFVLLLRQVTP